MRPLSLVTWEPRSRLSFPRGSQEKVSQTLKLVNASPGPHVAWKVRTAAPQSFLVAPRSGVFEKPDDFADVVITLLPGQGEGDDLRFEVQATALDGDVRVFSREDWRNIPKTSIQATEIRAILTAPPQLAARPDAQRSAVAIAADNPPDGGDAADLNGDRHAREHVESEQSLWRRPAASAASASWRDEERSRERLAEPRWQPDASKNPSSSASQGGSLAKVCVEGDAPPPQMTAATKAMLGILITLLALHLYVWPVVSAFMSASPEEPAGHPPVP